MMLHAPQLRQIAALLDALNAVEHDDAVYSDSPHDATLINSQLHVTDRSTGRLLGHICEGETGYVFTPCDNAQSNQRV